jgi:hypothetical protein
MVFDGIACFRMNKHNKAVAIERQPPDDFSELFRAKRKLATPVWMWSNWPLMNPPHLDTELIAAHRANPPAALDGAGVEIDMGVIGNGIWHRSGSYSSLRYLLKGRVENIHALDCCVLTPMHPRWISARQLVDDHHSKKTSGDENRH